MSEERSHFRIKKGEIEIEFAGESSEVAERYNEALEWIRTVSETPQRKKPETKKIEPIEEEQKMTEEPEKSAEKRGGRRSSVVSKEIDKMIEGDWFDEFRVPAEVKKELERLRIPASGSAVRNALYRRVGKTLDRIKDPEKGWIYRKMPE